MGRAARLPSRAARRTNGATGIDYPRLPPPIQKVPGGTHHDICPSEFMKPPQRLQVVSPGWKGHCPTGRQSWPWSAPQAVTQMLRMNASRRAPGESASRMWRSLSNSVLKHVRHWPCAESIIGTTAPQAHVIVMSPIVSVFTSTPAGAARWRPSPHPLTSPPATTSRPWAPWSAATRGLRSPARRRTPQASRAVRGSTCGRPP